MAACGRGNYPDASASSHTQPLAIKGRLIEKTLWRTREKVQQRLSEHPNLERSERVLHYSRAPKVRHMILMLCRPLHSEELFMPTWAPLSAALAGHQWAAGRVYSAVISAAAWATIGGQARDVLLRYGAVICEQNMDGKEIDLETCANLHRDINMLTCHLLLLERGGR